MIRALVDFALNNKFVVLAIAALLLIWGAISFHNLPVEAYPDVANNYAEAVSWRHASAGEEVEQQVTIPIEIQLNGLRSLSGRRWNGLSAAVGPPMIFDDDSENDWN